MTASAVTQADGEEMLWGLRAARGIGDSAALGCLLMVRAATTSGTAPVAKTLAIASDSWTQVLPRTRGTMK
jgi:hypothetical protein